MEVCGKLGRVSAGHGLAAAFEIQTQPSQPPRAQVLRVHEHEFGNDEGPMGGRRDDEAAGGPRDGGDGQHDARPPVTTDSVAMEAWRAVQHGDDPTRRLVQSRWRVHHRENAVLVATDRANQPGVIVTGFYMLCMSPVTVTLVLVKYNCTVVCTVPEALWCRLLDAVPDLGGAASRDDAGCVSINATHLNAVISSLMTILDACGQCVGAATRTIGDNKQWVGELGEEYLSEEGNVVAAVEHGALPTGSGDVRGTLVVRTTACPVELVDGRVGTSRCRACQDMKTHRDHREGHAGSTWT